MRTRNLETTANNLPLLHALGGFVAEQYKTNHVHTVLSTAVPPRTPLSTSTASSPSPLQAATVTSGGTFKIQIQIIIASTAQCMICVNE